VTLPSACSVALFPLLAVLAACQAPAPAPRAAAPVLAFTNGSWLGTTGFARGTRYVVGGRIVSARPARVDSTVDLAGGFVVPPFGEAHNHNVEFSTPGRTDSLIARYLRDGVFYVANPGVLPRGRAQLAGRVNVPGGVDAIFANGLLTATGGHPTGLYQRNLSRGAMTAEDGDGGFLWLIDTRADLDAKWPRILAQRPDFIKTVLVHSEEYARRRSDPAYFNWKGLNPALLPEIVRRAHAAGLRVMTHVETAADFHAALTAGADLVGHTPGFRGDEQGRLPEPRSFEIAPADAALAARRHVVVVTTLGGAAAIDAARADSALRRRFDALHRRNLRLLRDAGVHLAVGSDAYRDDSAGEVAYLRGLGVFDDLALLRLWSERTPAAIFPSRRVGCLADGCEASFLVLGGDPSADFSRVRDIRLRVKDGRILVPGS
jgi:imidazolonepropionase-like amidohydrolase